MKKASFMLFVEIRDKDFFFAFVSPAFLFTAI